VRALRESSQRLGAARPSHWNPGTTVTTAAAVTMAPRSGARRDSFKGMDRPQDPCESRLGYNWNDMSSGDGSSILLAAIVSSSDDAIVSKDLQGYVTSWNEASERLFGFSAAEMIGQHITRIIPRARIAEEDYVLSRIRAGLEVDHFETVRQRKDGSLVEISLTVSPIRNGDGQIVGASKIARDITERKRLERDALRLSAIVDSSEDAIVGKDLNGIVESWNAGAERMFGYTAAEAIGRSITLIIPPDRIEEEVGVLARIRAGQSVQHFETVRRRKNGELIDVSLSVSPIRQRNGTVIGASKIARDITEDKALRVAAADASRAKDEFLATLSHELRTPLNAVLGYAHMLQKGAIPLTELPKALDVIGRNADALTRLVNDVLDTSRIVTGKIRLNVEDCDVTQMTEDALGSVIPACRSKSIHLTSNIESGLTVYGDPDRLRQVLWNLLSNAVKFTAEGGEVKVSAVREDRDVRITVEDTGIGIPPESLPFVCRRFWQGDPTHTRSHGGLGLGLALAQHFVELHGGHIQASSEGIGRGSRFDVLLPAIKVGVRVGG
jgi:PAS domain S-box-containing protein